MPLCANCGHSDPHTYEHNECLHHPCRCQNFVDSTPTPTPVYEDITDAILSAALYQREKARAAMIAATSDYETATIDVHARIAVLRAAFLRVEAMVEEPTVGPPAVQPRAIRLQDEIELEPPF